MPLNDDSLIFRLNLIDVRRPDPPRNFRADDQLWFTWESPPIENFTHYRLRIDHDGGETDMQFPRGHHSIQLFRGKRFFLTTFNQVSGMESYPVVLEKDANQLLFGGQSGYQKMTQTVTLTSNSTLSSVTPGDNDLLTVYVNQDSTGGWALTWSSQFKNAPTTALLTTPLTQSAISFRGRGGFWWCFSWLTGLPDVG
jgi:hypothetical protein